MIYGVTIIEFTSIECMVSYKVSGFILVYNFKLLQTTTSKCMIR